MVAHSSSTDQRRRQMTNNLCLALSRSVVDIGIPQLSMHSIREMCGVVDVEHLVNLLKVRA